jgi:hypothetical protein
MEGCSDGTYPNTKLKYFSCSYGRGLYYPLENLQPDERGIGNCYHVLDHSGSDQGKL